MIRSGKPKGTNLDFQIDQNRIRTYGRTMLRTKILSLAGRNTLGSFPAILVTYCVISFLIFCRTKVIICYIVRCYNYNMTLRTIFARIRESKMRDKAEDLVEFKEDLENDDVDAEDDNP